MKKFLTLFLSSFLCMQSAYSMEIKPANLIPCTWHNCKTRLADQARLLAHLKAHKECEGAHVICQNPDCRKMFYKQSELQKHYRNKHPNLAAPLTVKIKKDAAKPPLKKKKKNTQSKKEYGASDPCDRASGYHSRFVRNTHSGAIHCCTPSSSPH